MRKLFLGAVLAAVPFAAMAEGEIIRHKTPNSTFPIARAVEIPATAKTYYISGMTPKVTNEAAPKGSVESFGDTKTQTISVLDTINTALTDIGLTMGDVVKMQVYLVAPEGETADFKGFMEGYTQYFGTEAQPNLPARSAMIVEALVNPAWLVEIEVTAAK